MSKQKEFVDIILRNDNLSGWSYGMLRCLEDEIADKTGAKIVPIKIPLIWNWFNYRFALGTRYEKIRKILPKTLLKLPSNVGHIYNVLMGPENYLCDLVYGWEKKGKRIIYLFDSLPSQIKRIKSLKLSLKWDVCITSFVDALPLLETDNKGSKWHCICQATALKYFPLVPEKQKTIAFSSYGRRHPVVHEAIKQFCRKKKIYYDYTSHDLSTATCEPLELFRQYAWHLSHSQFTVCWPVELTHPTRAGGISPITCRWFEAAAAGAVVLGLPPKNPYFREIFPKDMVHEVNPHAEMSSILMRLEELWSQRTRLSLRAETLRKDMKCKLDWSDRVLKMTKLASTL